MSKATYLIKRIKNMNFGNMFKTIDMVHEKNHKFKPFIFCDVVWCGLKYQAGYVDYYQFEMYKMNGKERKTVITRGINNAICKKYNDPSSIYKFEDKCVFNEIFNEYLNRDWLKLTIDNLNEFKAIYTETIYYKGYAYKFDENGFVDKTEINNNEYLEKSDSTMIKELTNQETSETKTEEITINEEQGE